MNGVNYRINDKSHDSINPFQKHDITIFNCIISASMKNLKFHCFTQCETLVYISSNLASEQGCETGGRPGDAEMAPSLVLKRWFEGFPQEDGKYRSIIVLSNQMCMLLIPYYYYYLPCCGKTNRDILHA